MSHITPWIIDSGAFDHMTDAHHLFSTCSPCAGNLKVKIANGTLSLVAGKEVFVFLSLLLSTMSYMYLIYLAICCLLAS